MSEKDKVKKTINGPLERRSIEVISPTGKQLGTMLKNVFILGNQTIVTKSQLFRTKNMETMLKYPRNIEYVRQHFFFLN